MSTIRTLYLFALAALTLWVATGVTLLYAQDTDTTQASATPALELACETDRIRLVIDQPACEYTGPTLGPSDPQFGPGATCLGPACDQPCTDPLGWLPPGQRLLIHLDLRAEEY